MSNDAKLGMDVQDIGRVDDSELFPVKVGDVVKVKALCEVVSDFFLDGGTNRNNCPFSNACKHIICEGCNESEFTTTVQAIIDRGQGWRFVFAGIAVEGSLSDYGKSFWKNDFVFADEQRPIFTVNEQLDLLKRFARGEWVDCYIIQELLGIDFSTGLRMFEFSRTVQWNPAPYNGQKVRTCFRIKLKKGGRG